LKATLTAADCDFDDILDVTTFHADPERQFETMMAAKGEVFRSAPYPA
jgi:enamine deaminase RidA (YjgF/YER057c/UK114 family)